MSPPPAGALGLVESPAQLLNMLELAHVRPQPAGLSVAVLAPRGGPTRDQLRAMVVLAREAGHEVLWYEPRLGLGAPGAVWGLVGRTSGVDRLVVGDAFSGMVQTLLALTRPRPVTLVDDGTATLEFARRWAAGSALTRWHHRTRPGAPQPLFDSAREVVSGQARRRLAAGGLQLFTAMPVELADVEVLTNAYAWVRQRFGVPEVLDRADLVGTSLVETGVVDPERYLTGVQALVQRYDVGRYLAHRKESADKLAQIAALGVDVVRPDLPLELVARRGPVGRTVLSFPSTVVHTLPLVLDGTGVEVVVCDIPREWYRRHAPNSADDFLGLVTRTARAQHGLSSVTVKV